MSVVKFKKNYRRNWNEQGINYEPQKFFQCLTNYINYEQLQDVKNVISNNQIRSSIFFGIRKLSMYPFYAVNYNVRAETHTTLGDYCKILLVSSLFIAI